MSNPMEYDSALRDKLEKRFELPKLIESINQPLVDFSRDLMDDALILLLGLMSKLFTGDPHVHESAIMTVLRVVVFLRHRMALGEDRVAEIRTILQGYAESLSAQSSEGNRCDRDRIILSLIGSLFVSVINFNF